jgi:hypothetical protein
VVWQTSHYNSKITKHTGAKIINIRFVK